MEWTYLITIASIIGTVANIFKRRWCFIIWIVTNTLWAVIDASKGLYSQTILFVAYFALSIWGLAKWGKDKGARPDDHN